jgi:putative restriction endonuclease
VTSPECLQRFDNLNVWERGSERAPHKPLLVLYALGRWQDGETRIAFREAGPVISELLQDFGPERKSYHPEYPFWYLKNDDVWEVNVEFDKGAGSSGLKRELLEQDAEGSLTRDVLEALDADTTLAGKIAHRLLEGHFPQSYHSDILDRVGLNAGLVISHSRKRDPRFRDHVLTAYEFRCAICGFDVRLGNEIVGLEAAHIKWHQSAGPDTADNGLALCSIHHKVFDRGVFTISDEGVMVVSDHANGSEGLESVLLRFHGRPIREAQRPEWLPNPQFLDWHRREVFRGMARA